MNATLNKPQVKTSTSRAQVVRVNEPVVHPFLAEKEDHAIQYPFSVPLMQFLLEKYNPINRPRANNRTDCYREDIRSDKWDYDTGNCILFDRNGNIIDGQHRLLAHILENRPMRASVIYGLPPKARLHIDNPRPRSAADNGVIYDSFMNGQLPTENEFKAARLLYRVAKWYTFGVRWMKGESNPRRRLSEAQLREIISQSKDQLSFAVQAASSKHTTRPGFLGALAIYYIKDPHKALKFREQIVRGVNATEAVVSLRDYLMTPSMGGDQPMFDHFNSVHAINCFHLGKPVSSKFPFCTRTSWAI